MFCCFMQSIQFSKFIQINSSIYKKEKKSETNKLCHSLVHSKIAVKASTWNLGLVAKLLQSGQASDEDITLEKILLEQIHGHSEQIPSFYYEEKCCGLFLVVTFTLPGNIILRILINIVFDFQTILLFAKITQSHSYYLSTSLVLKLLFVLSTLFLASFVNDFQLFKSFPMISSMTIFRKNIFQPMGPRFQNPLFSFSCSNSSCIHPHYCSMCFFTSQCPMTKTKYVPVG